MKPESAIQRDVRRYLALRGIESVSVPNGSHLAGDKQARIRQMAAMKADGLRVGFPDLMLFAPFVASVAFIEIKTQTGTVSKEQRECMAWLNSLGHRVAVVRSIGDMADALHEWGWSDGCVSIGAASLRVADRLRGALA